MFGVTIIKSPLAPFRLCLLGKAQKRFSVNFECYDLTVGKDLTVGILLGISVDSKVQDLTVEDTRNVN